MTEYVKPPFIYKGMLVYVEVKVCGNDSEGLFEISDIKAEKGMVEICSVLNRNCYWVLFSEIFVKFDPSNRIIKFEDSKFWKII